jgi:Transposase DDE domain
LPPGGPSRGRTGAGQPWYSPLPILTALTLRAVFHLALRQTEGLIGSLIRLLGLDLPVPDHTTLSRRGETLEVPRPRSGNGAEPVHLLVDRRHHIPKMSLKVRIGRPTKRARACAAA